MTEHENLAWLLIVGTVLELCGLGVVIGVAILQIRAARKEAREFFTAVAGMVHQEAARVITEIRR